MLKSLISFTILFVILIGGYFIAGLESSTLSLAIKGWEIRIPLYLGIVLILLLALLLTIFNTFFQKIGKIPTILSRAQREKKRRLSIKILVRIVLLNYLREDEDVYKLTQEALQEDFDLLPAEKIALFACNETSRLKNQLPLNLLPGDCQIEDNLARLTRIKILIEHGEHWGCSDLLKELRKDRNLGLKRVFLLSKVYLQENHWERAHHILVKNIPNQYNQDIYRDILLTVMKRCSFESENYRLWSHYWKKLPVKIKNDPDFMELKVRKLRECNQEEELISYLMKEISSTTDLRLFSELEETKNPQKVIDFLEGIIKKSQPPRKSRALLVQAKLFRQINQEDLALRSALSAYQSDPNHENAILLASLYEKQHSFEEAYKFVKISLGLRSIQSYQNDQN